MFSAIYMICAVELGGCMYFVDQLPYTSLEKCESMAEEQIAVNALRAENGEMIPHTAVYKCISWEEA